MSLFGSLEGERIYKDKDIKIAKICPRVDGRIKAINEKIQIKPLVTITGVTGFIGS